MDPRVLAACFSQVDPFMANLLWVGPNQIITVGPIQVITPMPMSEELGMVQLGSN
jgi:hypothetical protein